MYEEILKHALKGIHITRAYDLKARNGECLKILKKIYPVAGLFAAEICPIGQRELRNWGQCWIENRTVTQGEKFPCSDLVLINDFFTTIPRKKLPVAYKNVYKATLEYILIIENIEKYTKDLLNLYTLEVKRSGIGWALLYKPFKNQ